MPNALQTHPDDGLGPPPLIAKAVAHPLRARILQRLGERVASPGELALELRAPLTVVSYHVRMLRDYNCVEIVRSEPRRGALQHFYRATAQCRLDEDQWRKLPSTLRAERNDELVVDLVSDLRTSNNAGAMNDPEAVVTRKSLQLDERGWRKLNRLLTHTLDRADRIAAESAARQARGRTDGSQTELAILHFKRT